MLSDSSEMSPALSMARSASWARTPLVSARSQATPSLRLPPPPVLAERLLHNTGLGVEMIPSGNMVLQICCVVNNKYDRNKEWNIYEYE